MASAASSESQEPEAQERRSVLAELPHTRPQRPSARREIARERARAKKQDPQAQGPKAPRPKTPAEPQAPAPGTRRKAASKKNAKPSDARPRPATPRQGYEPESDLSSTPVSPPSGTEMLGALTELAGELVQTGISAGGRLLRSALSRVSGS